eukprot:CAMPEP_0197826134 /NCGR_PEP_ID=MMETSP1437-20131217/3127_1 /TAXON_ID=49252 ORGANISM="Eucampia antarctica, Strain CCMP1452" /NCGR_SAMPLE_ID=MMETSP1437 /ASSEMBLY_ACC=CAM_ASM_001096 /LENGTH=205 /DNA_ID=CAMNT_0043426425 /DNA_START=14 /DNA_END=628 /DNA_ORIENTATION=+
MINLSPTLLLNKPIIPSSHSSTNTTTTTGGGGNNTTTSSHHSNSKLDFVETAVWLLRSCGQHATAMQIWASSTTTTTTPSQQHSPSYTLKCQSYTAHHLAELWSSNQISYQTLVLQPEPTQPQPTQPQPQPQSHTVTTQLLQDNAQLGLSVFTMTHPKNEAQWRANTIDPLASNPQLSMQVVQLLKSIQPKRNSTTTATTTTTTT